MQKVLVIALYTMYILGDLTFSKSDLLGNIFKRISVSYLLHETSPLQVLHDCIFP